MNLSEARRRYASKFKPKAWIFWTDFLFSTLAAYAAIYLGATSNFFSPVWMLATTVGMFATLRAVLFIHELAHIKRGALPFFEFGFNLFLGVPFLAPSLLYTDTHGDHHRQNLFGTVLDPEYAPIADWSKTRVLLFVFGVILAPALLIIRWGVLGPLSYLFPPLRRVVVGYASSLVINESYYRAMPRGFQKTRFIVQEIACALWVWLYFGLWYAGVISLAWALQWAIIAAGTLIINQVRTLAAHRYDNDGHKLSIEEQLLDSINLDGGSFLTVLAAPVGLRFHALHHFLPNVPYHDLPKLHRQLIIELGPESEYVKSSRIGILRTVYGLLAKPSKKLSTSRAIASPDP